MVWKDGQCIYESDEFENGEEYLTGLAKEMFGTNIPIEIIDDYSNEDEDRGINDY
jgi:hypothetical protein